jgi:transcriptional regulator with XRE-family HTH domain
VRGSPPDRTRGNLDQPMTSAALSPVGILIREWRAARGKSQLALALHAGVSSRHLSFIETGRAVPSRDMVLLLSDALDVPLRERNSLLGAAGYAPLFPETALEAPEMAQVRSALEAILRGHGKNPTVVVNRRCDVVMSNDASRAVMMRLLPPEALPLATNMIRLIFSPDGAKPFIENWEDVALELAHRRLRDSPSDGQALLAEIAGTNVRVPALSPALTSSTRPHAFSLPIRFRRGDLRLDFFTTVTTLLSPLDVTVQELRIESMFPADARTERELHAIVEEREGLVVED